MKQHFLKIIFFALGFSILVSIQILYWKISTGKFIFYSYGDQEFTWLHPHLKDGMFSYRKGWFVYTPIMLLIIPGFYFLYKNHKKLFFTSFMYSLISIYIVFAGIFGGMVAVLVKGR